jgi:hypothetical protein
MEPAIYDALEKTLQTVGPAEAIDQLCDTLRQRKEYSSLFYTLLMKKRVELGVSPLPTGPSTELPASTHEAYEQAIRAAARQVGQLYLDEGNLAGAWGFFRIIGEREPVVQALEKYELGEGDEAQQVIELAFHQGLHPRKGFDWILQRFGICSAITLVGSNLNNGEFSHGPEVRDHCLRSLARSLHEQLVDRLHADIARREGSAPASRSIPELLKGRDWLMDEDNYHIDTSHLNSVVQMAAPVAACEEIKLVKELCQYGQRLAPQFQYAADPPFQDQYKDYEVYYKIVLGEDVEQGLAHFRAKADNKDTDYPINTAAEVLVNLLLRLGRTQEALDVARKHLTNVEERQLSCPGVTELCRRTGDFRVLAEIARERGDPVNFVAGLIAAGKK